MPSQSIPESVQNLINEYFNLKFNSSKSVKCPYFRNYRKIGGMKLRALSGKGTPEEIVTEAKIHSHLSGFNWKTADPEQIRDFMLKKDIGIDCSGLVTWLIYEWLKKEYNIDFFRKVRRVLRRGFTKWIRLLLRPVQNIDVIDLTSEILSEKVTRIDDIRPGDLIRSKKGQHILMVTDVWQNNEEGVSKLKYVHSSDMYGNDNGIRQGDIIVKDSQAEIKEQDWQENDDEDQNWTLKGFQDDDGNNGIYRLKMLDQILNKTK